MAEQGEFDLIVIGAGPGGYVAAIRAAQLGMTVACIDKRERLGGTCLNVGCIPSKALLQSSELYHAAKEGYAAHGIKLPKVELDLETMIGRKDKLVADITKGVGFLFRKNKITQYVGAGRIAGPNQVEVRDGDTVKETLKGRHILIATGSEPTPLPFLEFDGNRVISSTEALELTKVPKHLIVIGAGVIGLEMGSVWRRLGAEVTVIEMLPELLPTLDGEARKHAQRAFKKQGFTFHFGTKVTEASATKTKVKVKAETAKGEELNLEGDVMLVAIGRRPVTDGLGLDEAGVAMDDRGRVQVNEHYQTNVPSIYAIGDVIEGAMLAHKASEEGVACVELMAGKAGHVNYSAIPWVIYTWPEIAWIGPSEEDLKAEGREVHTGTFPFTASSRAKTMAETDGLVKIIADAKTDRLISAFIVGPHASEMLTEVVTAYEFAGSAEDLGRIIHAHPTLSESVKEAALAVGGEAIHI